MPALNFPANPVNNQVYSANGKTWIYNAETGAWLSSTNLTVQSVAGKTGNVTLEIADVTNLTSNLAAKAPLASPALTGTPTAPTAAAGTNTTQVATTAYVRTEVSNLVGAAPGTLDTLNELAAALGNDPNFATTTATALANRLRIDVGNQGLTGTQQGYGRTNLGISTTDAVTFGSVAASTFTGALTGNVTGNVTGSVSGNAGTVTNGVYTTGSYADPSWITSLAGSKVTGNISGNAGTVTNGVYTVGDQTIAGIKTFSSTIVGSISGNAGTVTNGVVTTGSYANPSWITELAASKLTGTALPSSIVTSSLTSLGTLSSLTVSGNVTVDTDTLFVDATNNAVGIGTTSPVSSYLGKLAVTGNVSIALGGKLYQFDATNSSGRYMQATANSKLSVGKYQVGGDVEQLSLDANGHLAVDTNTLYVDATNNRVGVGTVSPSRAFSVSGAGAEVDLTDTTQSGRLRIRADSTSGYFIESVNSAESAYRAIRLNNSAYLDAYGNLGLGVTPSTSTLRMIQGPDAEFVFAGLYPYVVSNAYYNSGWKYKTASAASFYVQAIGAHEWWTAPSGNQDDAISFTRSMVLNASGNLTISGTGSRYFRAETSTGASFRGFSIGVAGDATNYGVLQMETSLGEMQLKAGVAGWGGFLTIHTNGQERARIDASGNVGIGTSSLKSYSGYATITIGNDSSGGVIAFRSAYNSGNGAEIYQTTAGSLVFNINSSTTAATISAAGHLGLGVTPKSWSSSYKAFDIGNYGGVFGGAASFATASNVYIGGSPAVYRYKNTAAATLYETGGGDHVWYTAPSGTQDTPINWPTYMVYNSAGNLGLGVTPSAWSASFKALQLASVSALWSSSSGTFLSTNNYNDGSNKYIGNGFATRYYQLNGQHVWETAASNAVGAGAVISFTQSLTHDGLAIINQLALVANGTGTYSNYRVTNANSTAALSMGVGGSSVAAAVLQNNAYVWNTANSALSFGTNDAERVRITADGNLLVGTTSSLYATTNRKVFELNGTTDAVLGLKVGDSGKLYIQAYASNAYIVAGAVPLQIEVQGSEQIRFATNGFIRARVGASGDFMVGGESVYGKITSEASGSVVGLFATNATASSGTRYHAVWYENGTERGSITTNGSGTSYNTNSDMRVKENIRDADTAIAILNTLRIRQFEWATTGERQRYGVVAQEVASIFPEMVAQGRTDDALWQVDYSKLVPLLVKALQESESRITNLEAEVAALKA